MEIGIVSTTYPIAIHVHKTDHSTDGTVTRSAVLVFVEHSTPRITIDESSYYSGDTNTMVEFIYLVGRIARGVDLKLRHNKHFAPDSEDTAIMVAWGIGLMQAKMDTNNTPVSAVMPRCYDRFDEYWHEQVVEAGLHGNIVAIDREVCQAVYTLAWATGLAQLAEEIRNGK